MPLGLVTSAFSCGAILLALILHVDPYGEQRTEDTSNGKKPAIIYEIYRPGGAKYLDGSSAYGERCVSGGFLEHWNRTSNQMLSLAMLPDVCMWFGITFMWYKNEQLLLDTKEASIHPTWLSCFMKGAFNLGARVLVGC